MKLNRRFTGWRCAGVLADETNQRGVLICTSSLSLLGLAFAAVALMLSSVPSVSRWAVRVFAVLAVVHPAAGIWASRRRSIGG
jgi:hypothetical protein